MSTPVECVKVQPFKTPGRSGCRAGPYALDYLHSKLEPQNIMELPYGLKFGRNREAPFVGARCRLASVEDATIGNGFIRAYLTPSGDPELHPTMTLRAEIGSGEDMQIIPIHPKEDSDLSDLIPHTKVMDMFQVIDMFHAESYDELYALVAYGYMLTAEDDKHKFSDQIIPCDRYMYQNLANLIERPEFRAAMESVDKLVYSGATPSEHADSEHADSEQADSEMTDIDDSASTANYLGLSFFLAQSRGVPALTAEFLEGDTEVEDDVDSKVNQVQSLSRGSHGDLDFEDYPDTQAPVEMHSEPSAEPREIDRPQSTLLTNGKRRHRAHIGASHTKDPDQHRLRELEQELAAVNELFKRALRDLPQLEKQRAELQAEVDRIRYQGMYDADPSSPDEAAWGGRSSLE